MSMPWILTDHVLERSNPAIFIEENPDMPEEEKKAILKAANPAMIEYGSSLDLVLTD